MSNSKATRFTVRDLDCIKNHIERCLQHYMSQREVMSALLEAKIDPVVTEIVWQRLEAANPEFFRAYHLSLKVKDQILQFNELLRRQVELSRQICQREAVSITPPNRPQTHPINSSCYQAPQPVAQYMRTENVHPTVGDVPYIYANGIPSLQAADNMPHHGGVVVVPHNMLSPQSLTARMMQSFDRRMEIPACGYPGNSQMMFAADHTVLGPCNAIGESMIPPSNGGESCPQALDENMFDLNASSFGFLGQMPHSLRLSDLAASFPNDIPGSSCLRSSFQVTDRLLFDTLVREEQQENMQFNLF